ncbi:hypothetical protein pdam_00000071, partial [Pocillopora damicornis]
MFVVVDFAAGGKCTSTSSICIMAGEAVTTNGKQSILMLHTSHISKKSSLYVLNFGYSRHYEVFEPFKEQ